MDYINGIYLVLEKNKPYNLFTFYVINKIKIHYLRS